jgi:hypothetical protein
MYDDHIDGVRLRIWTTATKGLSFVPHVIYEHGEPWWDDIGRVKLLNVHKSSLAILPAESTSSNAGGTGEGNDEFC